MDGEINFEPPTVPGMRPFRMVYDDALLKVGTLIAWLGADSKLYLARITSITSPSGMTSIWIENIKFIRP